MHKEEKVKVIKTFMEPLQTPRALFWLFWVLGFPPQALFGFPQLQHGVRTAPTCQWVAPESAT